jgi:hypothetical protein
VARILHKLPIFRTHKPVTLPSGEVVSILPYQVVVWASIAPKGLRTLDARTPRFPIVLDPAFNHNFLIQEGQLRHWAGLRLEHFRVLDHLHAYGQPIALHAANVWLHPNRPGERDIFADRPPFCLELDLGIAIAPPNLTKPRLPLLGLRALFAAALQLTLDCDNGFLSLRTPRRFWIFG